MKRCQEPLVGSTPRILSVESADVLRGKEELVLLSPSASLSCLVLLSMVLLLGVFSRVSDFAEGTTWFCFPCPAHLSVVLCFPRGKLFLRSLLLSRLQALCRFQRDLQSLCRAQGEIFSCW
jgi:hypothetical protein